MPIDQGPFVALAELVAPDLDKKSTHFRVAHVRHFRKLKANFPMLDKKMYHEANESSLGVKLRRFQAWFQQYEEDVITMKRAKPGITRWSFRLLELTTLRKKQQTPPKPQVNYQKSDL